MEFRSLGATGLKVSRLALGTMGFGSKSWRKWALEEGDSRPIIRNALDLGINFFDTADMYSLGLAEQILGRALKEFGVARDRVVIGTKAWRAETGPVRTRKIVHPNNPVIIGIDHIDAVL